MMFAIAMQSVLHYELEFHLVSAVFKAMGFTVACLLRKMQRTMKERSTFRDCQSRDINALL
jgi:hypothetical protein